QWRQIAGKLKQISVGSAGEIWGVNSSDNIYQYTGENSWQQIAGGLKWVSVAADGTVFGVNSNDDIYRYLS
ncbi:MAG: hypothetical protein QNJ55_23470, partial [Xenococcus sp. MO_188.B8]|nr:hypothetical protein [Xenococcus sp. MO_188.B8]